MAFRSQSTFILTALLAATLVVAACEPQAPTQAPGITETSAPATLAPPQTETPAPPPPIAGQVVAAPGLVRLFMLGELNGWAIDAAHILRTVDGGETWFDVSLPGVSATGYAVSAFFLDAQQGWVLVGTTGDGLSGTLFRTGDGGAVWTSNPVPFGGAALRFLDGSTGWAMADLGAGAGSMAVAIFQTFDGGANWSRTYINDPTIPGAGVSLPLGGLKNDLGVLNPSSAWVSGLTYEPGQLYLYRTTDAGANWALQILSLPAGYATSQLSIERGPLFVNPTDGFLPVRYSGDPSQMVICTTTDSGSTWDCSHPPVPDGLKADFVSASDGFVWTGSSFYVTTDAAASWTMVTPDTVFGEDFAMMDFVSSTTGWVLTMDASSHSSLYRTMDGGASWTVLIP